MDAFEDRELAFQEKLKKEIRLLQSPNGDEIVLLESETEEDLRATHRRYFESLSAIKAGETAAFAATNTRFVKRWDVRADASRWRVQAEGVPLAYYPTKESAFAAAAKDARAWNRSTGNATGVRLWAPDGKSCEESFFEEKKNQD